MLFQVNGTDLGEMKVLRGKKNHKDIAKVITFNGDPGDFSFMLLVHISVVQRKHVYPKNRLYVVSICPCSY